MEKTATTITNTRKSIMAQNKTFFALVSNLDFCRKCEAAYTSSEGDFGMCGPCNDQSEAIAEQLRDAKDLLDELDELDAVEEAAAEYCNGLDVFYAEQNCLDDGR